MTPEEKQAARHTSRIISSVRKARGFTQINVAKKLGISQSALSKLESGQLIPSVFQWFEFCNMTSIPADSHVTGFVDFGRPVKVGDGKDDNLFKLPKRYATGRASTVRSMLPLVKWLEKKVGESKSEKVLADMGLDSDYFVQLDHTINIRFGLDLIQYLKSKGYYTAEDQTAMLKPVGQNNKFHGVLWSNYANVNTPINTLGLLLSKSGYYEKNFDYKIEESTKSSLEFSSSPGDVVLEDDEVKNHECSHFICSHRRKYFESMSLLHFNGRGVVEEKACYFKGADRCVFKVTLDG